MGDDAERLHRRLVDGLRRDGMLRGPGVDAAFQAVRRHWFLPGISVGDVYRDLAVVTLRTQDGTPISSSSQPALVALMLEQLAVRPGMSVLEIGTGTGYNAALLGELVGPGGRVVTVDLDPEITDPAERHLRSAGASNVTVETADGWQFRSGGPYDRIVVTVGVWDLSPAWLDQLAARGRLVAPLWLGAGQQASVAFDRAGAGLVSVSAEPCGFMRLRGPGSGAATYRRAGGWTVTLDADEPETVGVLTALLDEPSAVRPLPALARGWFTPIALAEPGAVNLFRESATGSVVRSGLLQLDPPGLAVVETRPPAANRLRIFGSDEPAARLLDALRRRPAVDIADLSITAVPAGTPVDGAGAGALATLVRPNYTFVVRAGGRSGPIGPG